MLKEHSNAFRRLVIIADLIIIAGAFSVRFFWSEQWAAGKLSLGDYASLLPLLLLVWTGLLYFFGVYTSFRTKTILSLLVSVLKGGGSAFILFGSLLYLLKIGGVSRLHIGMDFLLTTVLLCVEKAVMVCVFRHYRDQGYNFRNILLVGTGKRARDFIRMIGHHREWGLHIIGVVDENPDLVEKVIKGCKIMGALKDIPHIIHNNVVDEVVFIVPPDWLRKLEDALRACETEGVRVNVTMDFFTPRFSRIKVSDIYNFPLISFESTPDKMGHLIFKRCLDVTISTVAMVVLAPLFALIAVLVKWTSAGPVLFQQQRFGLNGRKFILYKFRTMVENAHDQLRDLSGRNEMAGPAFKLSNDPRVTPLGRVLRKFSLDELPQFLNVLRGDMSLIGPRPPIPAEVAKYDPWHRRRLRMRPGLACLWQVNGRSKITDFNNWVKMDLEYIDNWSLWLDCKIMAKTIPAVLFGVGAK